MSERVFIICEAGVNHNGDLDLARKLVDAAKEAGADAVKFQTFKADRLASAQAGLADYQAARGEKGSQLEMLRRLELSELDHRDLLARCRKARIMFLSTPFDEESADMLERLGMERFKVPSGELTNKGLVQHVARKGKPMIVSTGMATLAEVKDAVGWIRAAGNPPLTLLHCVTEYPAPACEINLTAMATMRKAFKTPVGYSDHTTGIEISIAAAALGAAVIEKHLTLDKNLPGPDHAASLLPPEFKALVDAIRSVESALGDGEKAPAPCERKNIEAARRSVVAARDLSAGTVLKEADLAVKRPGGGLPPARREKLLGKKLKRAVARDQALREEDL